MTESVKGYSAMNTSRMKTLVVFAVLAHAALVRAAEVTVTSLDDLVAAIADTATAERWISNASKNVYEKVT